MRAAKSGEAPERNSGIELLKIAAMGLIVLSHVVQTLSSGNTYVSYQDYVLDLELATTNPQQLVLAVLRYSGAFSNNIFFACSAWFLLESREVNKKKWWFILLEVWSISVVGALTACILRGGNVDAKLLLMSLFPTTLSLNWYMTCYLLFYLIHPFLNGIISRMPQKTLLKAASLLTALYMGCNFVIRLELFFSSTLMLWIAVYFLVAYMKLYCKSFTSSVGGNACLLAVTLTGQLGITLATNFLGLRIGFFSDKVLYWNNNGNPLLILGAIAAFNLARHVDWRSSIVNHVSKLSIPVYLIHDNLCFRMYGRPYLIHYVYENFGYQHIVFWILALTAAIFLASVCAGFLYEQTLQKLVRSASEKLCAASGRLYQMYENLMLKLH